ncbi:NAD-dependent succinate-semialdehyde dehydrogenase [Caballeronia zhejiangensis]|uniref:NAD-dependent succinate-semialdehyde dehydrogenase n=1 Tax=Caballeronia zhejiangensis TaxID=871203 RepID=UPI001EF3E233|nr:NAD-dependent succinate-semialdehyde dehydrogenase [Caballeronia zhejiangensis]MCG7400284.1 NAD-dependent succinate-semialdehyde dehydrogenase [Caballeronia zhejiangensis]
MDKQSSEYPAPKQFIDGEWRSGGDGHWGVVRNPATGEVLAKVPRASRQDLDDALASSSSAFEVWRKTPAIERAAVLRRAADLVRDRTAYLARLMTLEQGKTLAESTLEFSIVAETLEWNAAEALRANGRIIPARMRGARQMVVMQPLGPVAAFTPWNFPGVLPARKIATALAAGCTVVIKPAEETPASTIGIALALHDAGLPAGALNVVFGVPGDVSSHLIRSDIIRKVHFTGSTEVGRQLAKLAAEGLKPCTLELGGHAPVLVFDDANLDATVATSVQGKIRNAGQVCTCPTRFIVQEGIYEAFLHRYGEAMNRIIVGPGLDPTSQMGALANQRRIDAVDEMVSDAISQGGRLVAGGNRGDLPGTFWRPTLIADVPRTARAMNVEPFGPLALAIPFSTVDDGLGEANRLPYGLAGYAFTRSAATAVTVADELHVGGVGINTFAVSQIEAPFGGIKDSGYGVEGGHEGIEAFMHPRYVHHVT